MSESGKSAYFCHVFANNFFSTFFKKNVNGFKNQRESLHFLIPFLIFSKKFIFGHICTFFNFEAERAKKAQKG
jgi:hypothetical protein